MISNTINTTVKTGIEVEHTLVTLGNQYSYSVRLYIVSAEGVKQTEIGGYQNPKLEINLPVPCVVYADGGNPGSVYFDKYDENKYCAGWISQSVEKPTGGYSYYIGSFSKWPQ